MFRVGDVVKMRDPRGVDDCVGTIMNIDDTAKFPYFVNFKEWSHPFTVEELEMVSRTDTFPTSSECVLTNETKEQSDEQSEGERLKEFFFGKREEPESPLAADWRREGKCPKCGELGRIHLSTFVCSEHGEY